MCPFSRWKMSSRLILTRLMRQTAWRLHTKNSGGEGYTFTFILWACNTHGSLSPRLIITHSVPWPPVMFLTDTHFYIKFPASSKHFNMPVWLTSRRLISRFTFHSVYLIICLAACIIGYFFLHFFIPYSLFPRCVLLFNFIYSPNQTRTHTQTTPPCQSLNVSPCHPVTRVMTNATDYIPSTIPMVLISWLAAMQCDWTAVPLPTWVFTRVCIKVCVSISISWYFQYKKVVIQ